jgi:hypothetical protein
MVVAVIVFPTLVTGGIEKQETLNAEQIMQQLEMPAADEPADPASDADPAKEGEAAKDGDQAAEDDPMKALLEDAAKQEKKK